MVEGGRISLDFMENRFAVSSVWWEAGGMFGYEHITIERGGGPWDVLEKGGDTVLMKEVITVTKGTTRHTFLVSAMEVTMLSFVGKIDMAQAEDLITRTWPADQDIRPRQGRGRGFQGGQRGDRANDGKAAQRRVYSHQQGLPTLDRHGRWSNTIHCIPDPPLKHHARPLRDRPDCAGALR